MHKLLRVALDLFLLAVNFLQIAQLHGSHMAHGLEGAMAAAALAVAPGNGGRPVGRAHGLRQNGFDASDELFRTRDEVVKFFVHFGL